LQLRAEVITLKKKAAYEGKYQTLKTDFKLLFEQFE
jgi:hypothetical protein